MLSVYELAEALEDTQTDLDDALAVVWVSDEYSEEEIRAALKQHHDLRRCPVCDVWNVGPCCDEVPADKGVARG